MSAINRWLEFLRLMQIRYSHSVHDWTETALQTADAERVPADQFAKTVVYFGGTGFGIAVVPADQFVNLAELRRLLGLPRIRLASEVELQRLFPDCELGAMPPFGNAFEMPVTVDAGTVGDFIAFTVGSHRDVVRMSFADFRRLAKPRVASIALSEEVLVGVL